MGASIDLPPELVDKVLAHHRERLPILCASALVSSSWLYSSRHILFKHLFVRAFNAHALIKLLSSPLCTFRAHVRTLRLWGDQHGAPEDQAWIAPFVAHLRELGGWERLDKLMLEHINWATITGDTRNILVNVCAEIRKLHLREISFSSFPEFVRLVGAFDNLVELAVQDPRWLTLTPFHYILDESDSRFKLPSSSLRKLCLGLGEKHSILLWLTSLPKDAIHINAVDLRAVSCGETNALGLFFEALGDKLQSLELEFTPWDWGAVEVSFVNEAPLTHNTCLRSLTLSELPFDVHRSLWWILAILSEVPSVEEFAINVAYPYEESEWFALDEVLAPRAELRKVNILVFHQGTAKDMEKRIRGGLAGVNKRGVLDVIDQGGSH